MSQQRPEAPVGVMGYGEGGLIALYAAALDTRVQAAEVSGYFQPREVGRGTRNEINPGT